MGESGVGKSETAIELVKRGHRLVADDAVEIRQVSATAWWARPRSSSATTSSCGASAWWTCSSSSACRAVREDQDINLVVNLEQWNDQVFYDRLGH